MSTINATLFEGMKIYNEFITCIKVGKQGDISRIEIFIEQLIHQLARINPSDTLQRVPLEDIKLYSMSHSINVTLFSLISGLKLKKEPQDLLNIGIGAFLHDIGKINVPDHLVFRQALNSLSNECENKVIVEHPFLGAHWMSTYSIPDTVVSIIGQHHEHYDGSGYPKGIEGQNVGSAVSIVAISNFYDYLVTDLPGKPALEPREAMFELLQNSHKRFHPKFVSTFINNVGPYLMREPLYRKTALVMLDSREIAAVMNIERFGDIEPEILVLTNSQGKKLSRPLPINLKKDNSRKIVKLLKVS